MRECVSERNRERNKYKKERKKEDNNMIMIIIKYINSF